jgi:hypothetical protein
MREHELAAGKESASMERAGGDRLTVTTTRRIMPKQQGGFIEVPFAIPKGTEEIHVRYTVEAPPGRKAVIDLGVKDAFRVRGWSGGARSEFTLGREKATPGYMPGPLTGDGWAVLLGAYRVPEGGCAVTVTVEYRPETPRWLKGDLHMHSVHSDGVYTLEDNARIMEEMGCDFLAMTDHNTVSQNFAYPRNTNIVMIPGVEFTTSWGHANFLGAADPLDDHRVAGIDDVRSRLRTARERGAKIVLNHPHCPNCGWLWDFDVDHDWVEVWNGPWSEANRKTLEWWQNQLAGGRRLVAVGGSDKHRPHPVMTHAMPTTYVYSRSRTVAGILDGIDRGHVFISFSPQGPTLELNYGPYMMGDIVPKNETFGEIVLSAKRLCAGDKIRLISERGLEREIEASGDDSLELRASAAGRTFCRAEVWRYFREADQMLLAAMTNPIYFR